jgi:cytochrome oxidase Cu insertion factor (SCO1/SenC/PrrC family)
MSTVKSDGGPAPVPMRAKWFLMGLALWGVVGATGLSMLLRPAKPEKELVAVTEPAASDSTDATPQTVVLPINQSSSAGQVIDLSELMNQAKPVAETALWDPAGIEEFTFTNCDGKTVTKADLLGRPWAVCFVFTKCLGPCPTVTKQMRELQDRLKDEDVRLVTLTVDPARDTVDVLANYAKLNGADLTRWYFLTGDQAAIYGLIHRSFKMPVQEQIGPNRQEGFEVIHSTNVMLVDAEGVVRGKFNAAKDEEMVTLRRELADLAVPSVVAGAP